MLNAWLFFHHLWQMFELTAQSAGVRAGPQYQPRWSTKVTVIFTSWTEFCRQNASGDSPYSSQQKTPLGIEISLVERPSSLNSRLLNLLDPFR
jgi:hypothetical protein